MKIAIVVIFILLLLFLQIGIFPRIAILGAYPNLILLFILSLSILNIWRKNLGWIIAAGLFLDFYSLHNILGVSVISLIVAGIIIYFLSQSVFKKTNSFSLILLFASGILIYNILSIIIFKVFGISFNFRLISLIIGVIYNLIFALPIFYIVKWYVGKFRKI